MALRLSHCSLVYINILYVNVYNCLTYLYVKDPWVVKIIKFLGIKKEKKIVH